MSRAHVSVPSHMGVVIGHRFIKADPVPLVMNQRMVGFMEFDQRPLPVVLREDVAHQRSRLLIARHCVGEIAEHRSEFRLIRVLEAVPVAVNVGSAKRRPDPEFQGSITADYWQNEDASDVEIDILEAAKIALQNPISSPFLGRRPIIRRRRMKGQGCKSVVNLSTCRADERHHFLNPVRRRTAARQTYRHDAGLVASRFRSTSSTSSRTA